MVVESSIQNGPNPIEPDQLLSKAEIAAFTEMLPEVIGKVLELTNNTYAATSEMNQMIEWMTNVIQCNVPSEPSKLGGILVPAACKSIMQDGLSQENFTLSYALGWGLEICHSARDMSDNIMDNVSFTKGENIPTWHTRGTIGMTAINDVFVLGVVQYNILKIFCQSKPYYHQLHDSSKDANQKNILGRGLWEQMEKQKEISKSYTMKRYRQVIDFMVNYYSFYGPFEVALIMAGRNDEGSELKGNLKNLMRQIGFYNQIIEDFENIFGKSKTWVENASGKLRRLTWFFVKALETANEKLSDDLIQLTNSQQNNPETGEKIRKLYINLGLLDKFEVEKKNLRSNIFEQIGNISKDGSISPEIFHCIMAIIDSKMV